MLWPTMTQPVVGVTVVTLLDLPADTVEYREVAMTDYKLRLTIERQLLLVRGRKISKECYTCYKCVNQCSCGDTIVKGAQTWMCAS